jgi:DNA-binding transcriptional LysR family regulator
VALALSTTAAVRSAVLAGAGPAVLSELTVAEDIATRRLARVPVAGVNLHRSLRAIWTEGNLPPMGAAHGLLAHVSAVRRRTERPRRGAQRAPRQRPPAPNPA